MNRHNEALIKILFASPYPTDPEKRPYSKNFISIFSQEYFFLISLQPERIVQCKKYYLKAAWSVIFDLLILKILFLFFKNTVKILKFR